MVHPPRGEKSETTGVQGQPQTSKAVFTAHGRVDKDWPKVNEIDTTKDIKIVDDQGNLVSTLTVPGEGKYDVAPDGSITFTPDPQFTGTAKGIVLRATDLNGNTSAWTSNTAENNLENNNNGVNGTTTMDAVYIPTVTAVTQLLIQLRPQIFKVNLKLVRQYLKQEIHQYQSMRACRLNWLIQLLEPKLIL